MEKHEIIILGAGLAGLELGRRLGEAGKDFIILEKEPQIGGICRTNRTGDYYWDFGAHVMYSRYEKIKSYYRSLSQDYGLLDRNVRILHTGGDGRRYLLDYPFEVGIKDMPLTDRLECIIGYLTARARGRKDNSNLEDCIKNLSGDGISKHFMTPYNNKIWNCSLDGISSKIVSSKIDPLPIADFVLSALGGKIVGRAYQATFVYPRHGIQELADQTAKDIMGKIILNSSIESLVKHDDGWVVATEDGKKRKAGIIVSTMPLVELLKRVDIDGLDKEYDAFKWNNTFFIMVGLKRGCDFGLVGDCQWAFFKEGEAFYRITMMHNLSRELPHALVAEITQKGVVLGKSRDEVKNLVIEDLLRLGIIGSRSHIAESEVKLLEYTYPIPTVGLEETKEYIRGKLGHQGIFLLGRNGNWDYINMDKVIKDVEEFFEEKFRL